MPRYQGKWMQNGIFYAIMLLKHQIKSNPPMLSVALCYWDSTSNTFAFGPSPITPTILNMAALFDFRPCRMRVDVLGDYELKNHRIETPMKATKTEIRVQAKKEGNLVSLTNLNHPWFAVRSFHKAPTHWKDLTTTRAIVHAKKKGISCLPSRGLFFGGIHIDKRYQYGMEAYNPQFTNRQFGLVQVIPELCYSFVKKGSSCRNMNMTPMDVMAIRTAWRTKSKSVRVPPYEPTLLYTPAFHEFWRNKLFSWLLESAKLLYTTAFKNCPFTRTRRGIHAEEVKMSSEAGSDR
ncbi:uncharacterized protein Pyn_21862 [Prunus yedoensis var. nudiflora]|uniref:Uncharacterized protein n=1 Tax=Prunus yedoensis var. nudiflora TaxID=2094558 RepID=A0A314XP89_PRUYE|nr:uncharacterized protein Pyn_21862 [Prunus yedoensis var. nudiflora]